MNRSTSNFGQRSALRGGAPRGFTLVELLVVIAIMGILMALTLPGVQAAREAARRAQCSGQLGRLSLAMQNYEAAHAMFPAGVRGDPGPIRSEPKGQHHNWIVPLLPYLEEQNIFARVDLTASVYDARNEPVRSLRVAGLTCPSAPNSPRESVSNYAASHHDVEAPIDAENHGVFFLDSHVTLDDIRDGSSHTIFIGEKLQDADDLGWMSGTRATLRNTGTPINARLPIADAAEPETGAATGAGDPALRVGGFCSQHPAGANFAFGDGHVRLLPAGIDRQVYQQLGHRADGKLLGSLDAY